LNAGSANIFHNKNALLEKSRCCSICWSSRSFKVNYFHII